MTIKKGGLGKGLDAIFMENGSGDSENRAITLRISDIEPNKSQPRSDFDEESLTELAESISRHGILQPLLVRPLKNGRYQIVAGERRWRASRMAGISEVPAIVRELDDAGVMELALIENLQREDLSPVEEAMGYRTLMDAYDFTQEEVSKSVGKSRSAVANALRILKLPQSILEMISDQKLTAGHAKALLSLESKDQLEHIADIAYKQAFSVRQLENLVHKINSQKSFSKDKKKNYRREPFFDEVELSLKEVLGRKVRVTGDSKKKGVLQIEFYGEDDLTALVQLLGR